MLPSTIRVGAKTTDILNDYKAITSLQATGSHKIRHKSQYKFIHSHIHSNHSA